MKVVAYAKGIKIGELVGYNNIKTIYQLTSQDIQSLINGEEVHKHGYSFVLVDLGL